MRQFKIIYFLITLYFLTPVSCTSQNSHTEEDNNNLAYFQNGEVPVNTASDHALQSFKLGMAEHEMNNSENARKHFDDALRSDPNFVSAQLFRLINNSSVEDWGKQFTRLKQLKTYANPGEILMINAMEAYNDGDDDSVESYYNKLINMYPKSSMAHCYQARHYNSNNETEMARGHWKKALNLNPKNLIALTALGFNYIFSEPKHFDMGEEYLLKVSKLKPDEANAYTNLGDAFRAQNKLEYALENYIKAAELSPNEEKHLIKAGHACTMSGNYDMARSYYNKAKKVSEYGQRGGDFYALTYLYQGDHKMATKVLNQRILDIENCNMPSSIKNLSKYNTLTMSAEIAMHYNNTDQLKQLINKMQDCSDQFIQEVNSNAAIMFQKAYMAYWQGLEALAEDDFAKAEERAAEAKKVVEPMSNARKLDEYHFLMGRIHYKKGNYAQATAHFEQANMNDVYHKYFLSKSYEKQGDHTNAQRLFADVKAERFNSVGNAIVKSELSL